MYGWKRRTCLKGQSSKLNSNKDLGLFQMRLNESVTLTYNIDSEFQVKIAGFTKIGMLIR